MTWIDRTYDVLGVTILVRCRHAACADGVAEHFGPMAAEPWTTPDVIVECDLEAPRRELFRSRVGTSSTPFDGVRVRTRGMAAAAPWTALEPPLVPLGSEPLRDRLVGLHAALVAVGPDAALAILGDRGSGKTTLALMLAALYNDCALMGDEWTFLLRRTTVALAFPQAVGLKHADRGKRWRRPDALVDRIELQPRRVSHIVLLTPGAPSQPQRLDPVGAFSQLQQHHLAAGTRHDEAMVTLARLCREVPVTRIAAVEYADRKAATAAVRALVTGAD